MEDAELISTVTGEQLMELVNEEFDLIMELDFAKNYFDIVAKQSGYTVDENYFRGARFSIEEYEQEVADVTIQYTGVQYLLDGMEISLADSGEELEMECTLSQNLGNKEDLFKHNLIRGNENECRI